MNKKKQDKPYGTELVLDLHECDPSTFTRKSIRRYFKYLCDQIDMNRNKLVWWDDLYTPAGEEQTLPHLVGTSAIQFITTSNITIHTLDLMKRVYLNIFTCKYLDAKLAKKISIEWFKGKVKQSKVFKRI